MKFCLLKLFRKTDRNTKELGNDRKNIQGTKQESPLVFIRIFKKLNWPLTLKKAWKMAPVITALNLQKSL